MGVLGIAALLWMFAPLRVIHCDGSFELTVSLVPNGERFQSLSFEVFPTRESIPSQTLEYLLPPEVTGPGKNPIVEPWNGGPVKFHVLCGFKENQSGRLFGRWQYRTLLVIGKYADGRRVGKVVDIPDRSESREITIQLP